MNDFNPRTNIVKDEEGDFVTEFLHILFMWWKYFSQHFCVHGVSDLRQTEIYTAQSIAPELSAFEFEMAIEKVKSHITRYLY